MMTQEIVVAMTGASGAAYGLRFIQRLARAGVRQHLLFSDAAKIVLKQECDLVLPDTPEAMPAVLAAHLDCSGDGFCCYAQNDWFSPAASGSSGLKQMVIIPCSMGSLARIAMGASDNLIERAADVILKERHRLIVVPREMPLSAIHLEHMLKLSRLGVDMMPAMPGYYHRPASIEDVIDFVVERVLDHVDIAHEGKRWGIDA